MGLTERECWFWLCTRPWLGVRSIDKLLGYFKTAKNIYYGRNSQYTQICGIEEKLKNNLQNAEEKNEENIKREMFRLNQSGGKFVCRIDSEYMRRTGRTVLLWRAAGTQTAADCCRRRQRSQRLRTCGRPVFFRSAVRDGDWNYQRTGPGCGRRGPSGRPA